MKIVVTGGRKYGKMPDWNGGKPLIPDGYYINTDGEKEYVDKENPDYIDAARKAGFERGKLYSTLDHWLEQDPGLVLGMGDARGADLWALRWAEEKGVPHKVFEADWGGLGKAAGPIRNRKMLEEFKPDLVLAFPGGKGTESTIQMAKLRRIPVIKVTL